jgi:hypothetical protein
MRADNLFLARQRAYWGGIGIDQGLAHFREDGLGRALLAGYREQWIEALGEGGQAMVGNGTQAARDTAPEMAAKLLPALTDSQQTRMTIVGEPERAPASVPAQSKK